MLFPRWRRAAGVVARGAPPADRRRRRGASRPDRRNPPPSSTTMTITRPSGPTLSGVVIEESDFYVTLRDADGTVHVVRRTPALKMTRNNPLQAHIDLLDRVTDTQIHDLVAYLETMK